MRLMNINTDYLDRCIQTLESAFDALQKCEPGEMMYDIYRAACAKEFELVPEQSGSLLKKRLRPYFASNRQADRLVFKDIFRYAAKHDLVSIEVCERWMEYRDNRNDTARRYGERYAETTLVILPAFIADARDLAGIISKGAND